MKTFFEFEIIDGHEIDLEDKRFKITNDRDDGGLERSIRSFGVLNPPLLLKTKRGFCIISGFRRMDVLNRMGYRKIEARIAHIDDDLTCAQMAIMDNACQRQLSVAEQIRGVNLISSFFVDPEQNESFFQTACDALMLPGNKGYIKKLLMASRLSGRLLDLVAKERISIEVAIDLASFDSITQEQFYPIFSEFKVSLSKQKELILMVREIAAREKRLPVDVLLDVSRMIGEKGDISDKNLLFSCVRNYLHQNRYPEITKAMDHQAELLSRLNVSDGIKFTTPDSFEGMTYHIQLQFQSLAELKQLHKKIENLCGQPEMEMLLKRDYMLK